MEHNSLEWFLFLVVVPVQLHIKFQSTLCNGLGVVLCPLDPENFI